MKRGQGGFALMATLWLLVAISAVTLEMGLQGRLLRTAAANRVEASRARAVAEAGLQHALADLTRRARSPVTAESAALHDPWAEPARLMPGRGTLSGGARYEVTARDVGALLNLNHASELEFRRFFAALAVDDSRADRIAQAAMDWKDRDQLRRARGGEVDEYLAEGAAVLPADGPFNRVEELRHLLGMTAEIYERVAPLVTVAGTGRVNLAAAPVPVLSSLPGMEPGLVRAVLEQRRRGPLGSIVQVAGRLPPDQRAAFEAALPDLLSRTTVETLEVELVSEGWYEGGLTRFRAEAIAVRSGSAVFLFRSGVR